MKVTKNINDKGIEEIVIIITKEDAELLQIAILQFAEKVANSKKHQTRMRRLSMLVDKTL